MEEVERRFSNLLFPVTHTSCLICLQLMSVITLYEKLECSMGVSHSVSQPLLPSLQVFSGSLIIFDWWSYVHHRELLKA